jgi:hypothetical protein
MSCFDHANNTGVDSDTGDLDDEDNDDDEVAMETVHDQATEQSYMAMVDSATTGTDLLKLIDLLPNSSQYYGHSITMNALIKIIICHPSFREWSDHFYCIKVKKGEEQSSINIY